MHTCLLFWDSASGASGPAQTRTARPLSLLHYPHNKLRKQRGEKNGRNINNLYPPQRHATVADTRGEEGAGRPGGLLVQTNSCRAVPCRATTPRRHPPCRCCRCCRGLARASGTSLPPVYAYVSAGRGAGRGGNRCGGIVNKCLLLAPRRGCWAGTRGPGRSRSGSCPGGSVREARA